MRPSTVLAGTAAGAVLALGTAGVALAAPAATPSAGPSAAASPAAVFVSPGAAAPGQVVRISGTCALPATDALPTVVSVTSPAFAGSERFSKTDPNAFDGTATLANVRAGSYTVTLTCSNGTATTSVRVLAASGGTGGNATPATPVLPAPATQVPAASAAPAEVPAEQSGSDSHWVGAGIAVLAVAAAGATGFVATSRRRNRGGAHRDHTAVCSDPYGQEQTMTQTLPAPVRPRARAAGPGPLRRHAWLLVLAVGALLFLAVERTMVGTRNPNFVPAAILLGASVVPAAFLAFVNGRRLPYSVPFELVAGTAFFGGVVGTVVAGLLEYETMRDLGGLPMLGVGLIEEASKLIAPLALLPFLRAGGGPHPGRRAAARRRLRRRLRRPGDHGLRLRHPAAQRRQHHRHGRHAGAARPAQPGRTHGLDRHRRRRAVRGGRVRLEASPGPAVRAGLRRGRGTARAVGRHRHAAGVRGPGRGEPRAALVDGAPHPAVGVASVKSMPSVGGTVAWWRPPQPLVVGGCGNSRPGRP